MEQWMKKLSGVMIASAIALTLSTKASADGDPPPETTVIEDNAGAADGSGTAGGTDPTRDGDDPADAPADPTGSNVGPYIQIDNNVSSDPPVVIDPDAEDDIDMTDDEDGTGFWGYEAGEADSQSDNTVYMVDNSLQSITAYETDLHIEAAGLNEINSIAAGQDLYISGTGIMLLDYLMIGGSTINPLALPAEGIPGFFLQPLDGLENNGSTGSVAVFLLSDSGGSSDGSGTGSNYVLINGSVPGILDESYVIPSGKNLIMPGGTSIELVNPKDTTVTSDVEFADTCGQFFEPSSSLTISSGSTMTLQGDATITMRGEDVSGSLAVGRGAVTYAPVLNVEGSLLGSGSITGKGLVELNLGAEEPVPSAPSIDSRIFKLVRRSGNIVFKDLDDELYKYLDADVNMSDEDFAIVTSQAGLDGMNPLWGVHTTVFGFEIDDSKTAEFGSSGSPKNGIGGLGWFKWGIVKLGAGGGNNVIINTTGSTGSSIIGGKYAGSYKPSNHSLILVVTDRDICYNLAAYYDGKQIFSLNSKVTVRFDYPVPASEGRFFVVFRNGDGSLTAFAARYDAVAGQLVFSGDKLGDFVVVCPDGFDGEIFSEDFYAFLETIDSVKALKASF